MIFQKIITYLEQRLFQQSMRILPLTNIIFSRFHWICLQFYVLILAPATINIWANFLATHSTILHLNPPQCNHPPMANHFARSSLEILLQPALRSGIPGPGCLATVTNGASEGSFGDMEGLWEVEICVIICFWAWLFTRCSLTWLFLHWHSIAKAGSSSGISLYVTECFISSRNPIPRASLKAKGF